MVKLNSLEAIGERLTLTQDMLEQTMPGAFNPYNPVKQKSCDLELASSGGIIKKRKRRKPEKTLYEFFALNVWHNLLEEYSKNLGIRLRSPKPLGVGNLDKEYSDLFMGFINGYELNKINCLGRLTPVKIRGQKYPVPLYPACAFHLGALDEVKEREGLLHSDYAPRHVIFSPIENVEMGVVDLENSRREEFSLIRSESDSLFSSFQLLTSSERDKNVLEGWYSQGREIISQGQEKYIDNIVESLNREYDITCDIKNMSLNGIPLKR